MKEETRKKLEEMIKELEKEDFECDMCMLEDAPKIIIEKPIINIYVGSGYDV